MLAGRWLKPRVVLLEVMAVGLLALRVVEAVGWKLWFKIGKKKDISSWLSFFSEDDVCLVLNAAAR
jgi:hypothetical protein